MIVSFADRGTKDIYHGGATKAARRTLPVELHPKAGELLDRLDETGSLRPLRLPGLRLEKLRGDRVGQYSIRINDQYRICFRWSPDGAESVEIVDYH